MRTEDDLRAAIDTLADSAPADALARLQLPAPPPRSRLPVRRLVLVAASLVLAVAIVGVGLMLRPDQREPADRRTPGYWAMISAVEPPAGWRVIGRGIEGVKEYTELTDGAEGGSCSVTAFGRGQFAPPPTGRPVRVGERPATFQSATGTEPALLSWAYDEDAYALVTCLTDRPATQLIALAEATRFDGGGDFAVPYRLGGLPSGYRPASVQSRESDGATSVGVLLKADDLATIAVANVPVTFDPAGPGMPGVEELQINGRPATVREDQRALSITVGDRYLRVSSYATDQGQSWLPGEKERLLEVARGLQPAADLNDPGTWFPAQEALR